ncbi:MAG: hypothetical protein E6G51_11065 [Actinobacteria bacterium]|nr:MAG: hypothetical protein E6G51_11065 [Actinomycetota bacterium]
MKKESLPRQEREALLAEVRSYLPAFLNRGASEQPDPAGDVRELLGLEREDLEQVVAVHQCLAAPVLRFGEEVEAGVRRPLSQQALAAESSQAIRGHVNWNETFKERARAPGEVAKFSVFQSSASTYDTAENRALVWLLDRLDELTDKAVFWSGKRSLTGQAEPGWSEQIEDLRDQVAAARQVPWLSQLAPQRPESWVLQALRASSRAFYAIVTAKAIESVIRLDKPTPGELASVLSERYFQPEDDGTLFEVAVALRLAKAFGERSPSRRKTRLLMGEGRTSFARFAYEDGSEVSIAYQAWPDGRETMRRTFIRRHAIGPRPSNRIPDLIILRTGSAEDAVILELKASSDASYLRGGLQELLAYLADRPDLWGARPMGWLIAPSSDAFQEADADEAFPLWVLSADAVGPAATDRFTAATSP